MTRTPWNQVRDDSRLVEVMSAITAARDGAGPERQPLSVFIMPNLTLNGLESFIDYQSLLGGVDVTVTMGRYNVLHQDLMNPDSMVFTAKPQLLVLALAWDVFVPDRDATVEIVIERLEQLFMLAANRAKCAVVVNTFVLPGAVYDRGAAAMSLNGRIHAVNDWIRHFVAEHQAVFFLCDWNAYVQQTGREAALDDRYWMMAKAPFRPAFLARYGADIAKIGRALLGLNKKVLILDCDNTLWGGVLGEDGIDGIRLHSDDYPGNAYQAAQRIVLDLADRGVLLAACSKNNQADVLAAMNGHAHCLLKPENFAAMRINWDNKADNILALSEELNLGLDSFVFVDDSSFEIEMVQTRLPAVTTVQVPDKIYAFPQLLAQVAERYFYAAAQTAEDAARSDMYKARKQADTAKAAFSDTVSYLRSLDISLECRLMAEGDVARVAQLTGKTNQFNVAKHAYSEAEIGAALESEDRLIYVARTSDKFGELGLTIVCIVHKVGDSAAKIDSFLMSCRVFERNLEYAFLSSVIVDIREKWSIDILSAAFIPSDKNAVCRDFFVNAGFTANADDNDVCRFEIDVTDYVPTPVDYIRLT